MTAPPWLQGVKWAAIRDGISFLGGMALLGYETVITPEPRIAILGVACAMVGLPGAIFTDRTFTQRPKEPTT